MSTRLGHAGAAAAEPAESKVSRLGRLECQGGAVKGTDRSDRCAPVYDAAFFGVALRRGMAVADRILARHIRNEVTLEEDHGAPRPPINQCITPPSCRCDLGLQSNPAL